MLTLIRISKIVNSATSVFSIQRFNGKHLHLRMSRKSMNLVALLFVPAAFQWAVEKSFYHYVCGEESLQVPAERQREAVAVM